MAVLTAHEAETLSSAANALLRGEFRQAGPGGAGNGGQFGIGIGWWVMGRRAGWVRVSGTSPQGQVYGARAGDGVPGGHGSGVGEVGDDAFVREGADEVADQGFFIDTHCCQGQRFEAGDEGLHKLGSLTDRGKFVTYDGLVKLRRVAFGDSEAVIFPC